MIRVKLMSILVNDQDRARRFYTDVLGFRIKHDIPLGKAAWLTLVAPDAADGVEPCSNRPVIRRRSRCSRLCTAMAFRWRNSTPRTSPPSSRG